MRERYFLVPDLTFVSLNVTVYIFSSLILSVPPPPMIGSKVDNFFPFSNLEWKVLYTTQLTQKAKKYHDGFLKLAMCGSQRRQVIY